MCSSSYYYDYAFQMPKMGKKLTQNNANYLKQFPQSEKVTKNWIYRSREKIRKERVRGSRRRENGRERECKRKENVERERERL